MNIKLINDNSSVNIHILKDTTCSYLYKIAVKSFKIPIDRMTLFYKSKVIENNTLPIYSIIFDGDEYENNIILLEGEVSIIVKRKIAQHKIKKRPLNFEELMETLKNKNIKNAVPKLPLINNIKIANQHERNSTLIPYNSYNINNTLGNCSGTGALDLSQKILNNGNVGNNGTGLLKIRNIKKIKKTTKMYGSYSPINTSKFVKIPVQCQQCTRKNAIFYCRQCNAFVCLECNVRFQDHVKHDKINVEDGNLNLACKIYRDDILKYLSKTEEAYNLSIEWMIEDRERDNYLEKIFELLDLIKCNTNKLFIKSTGFALNQNVFDNFKKEINIIQPPNLKEEVNDIFNNYNIKEREVFNYIKCVDLQIIKSEYNSKIFKLLNQVEGLLEDIVEDVNDKLDICEGINEFGIEEINDYIKRMTNNKDIKNINDNKDNSNDNNNNATLDNDVPLNDNTKTNRINNFSSLLGKTNRSRNQFFNETNKNNNNNICLTASNVNNMNINTSSNNIEVNEPNNINQITAYSSKYSTNFKNYQDSALKISDRKNNNNINNNLNNNLTNRQNLISNINNESIEIEKKDVKSNRDKSFYKGLNDKISLNTTNNRNYLEPFNKQKENNMTLNLNEYDNNFDNEISNNNSRCSIRDKWGSRNNNENNGNLFKKFVKQDTINILKSSGEEIRRSAIRTDTSTHIKKDKKYNLSINKNQGKNSNRNQQEKISRQQSNIHGQQYKINKMKKKYKLKGK